jgi:hypothetical protein
MLLMFSLKFGLKLAALPTIGVLRAVLASEDVDSS